MWYFFHKKCFGLYAKNYLSDSLNYKQGHLSQKENSLSKNYIFLELIVNKSETAVHLYFHPPYLCLLSILFGNFYIL